ncbi:hypothetical protein Hanom_Chr06g00579231 [Helianthus anomalus]
MTAVSGCNAPYFCISIFRNTCPLFCFGIHGRNRIKKQIKMTTTTHYTRFNETTNGRD